MFYKPPEVEKAREADLLRKFANQDGRNLVQNYLRYSNMPMKI